MEHFSREQPESGLPWQSCLIQWVRFCVHLQINVIYCLQSKINHATPSHPALSNPLILDVTAKLVVWHFLFASVRGKYRINVIVYSNIPLFVGKAKHSEQVKCRVVDFGNCCFHCLSFIPWNCVYLSWLPPFWQCKFSSKPIKCCSPGSWRWVISMGCWVWLQLGPFGTCE